MNWRVVRNRKNAIQVRQALMISVIPYGADIRLPDLLDCGRQGKMYDACK
jgi:hypothetical protein